MESLSRRWMEKKHQRYSAVRAELKDYGLTDFSETCSRNLIVVNLSYSQARTLLRLKSQDSVANILNGFTGFRIFAFPTDTSKTFCLLMFDSVQSAKDARVQLHEKPFAALHNHILFVEYWPDKHTSTREIRETMICDRFPDVSTEAINFRICRNVGGLNGLHLVDEFVTADEESILLKAISTHSERWCQIRDRRAIHFGYAYNYESFTVTQLSDYPIPDFVQCLIERARIVGLLPVDVDQLTIQEYPRGAGIASHVDRHSIFDNGILILSIGSQTTMDFDLRRPYVPANATGVPLNKRTDTLYSENLDNKSIPVLLRRRSLLVVQDEARYKWCHGVKARNSDSISPHDFSLERGTRTSLTFRKIACNNCSCTFKDYCY